MFEVFPNINGGWNVIFDIKEIDSGQSFQAFDNLSIEEVGQLLGGN